MAARHLGHECAGCGRIRFEHGVECLWCGAMKANLVVLTGGEVRALVYRVTAFETGLAERLANRRVNGAVRPDAYKVGAALQAALRQVSLLPERRRSARTRRRNERRVWEGS